MNVLQVTRQFLWKKRRFWNRHLDHKIPIRQAVEESLEKPRPLLTILTWCTIKIRNCRVAIGSDCVWKVRHHLEPQQTNQKTKTQKQNAEGRPSATSNATRNHVPSRPSPSSRDILRDRKTKSSTLSGDVFAIDCLVSFCASLLADTEEKPKGTNSLCDHTDVCNPRKVCNPTTTTSMKSKEDTAWRIGLSSLVSTSIRWIRVYSF